ncbi:DUF547 domain-containing protein [Mangrovivirga sp. M17]|uniref:DUF547 domain-containing protein n=1 Tax=Mangrovivirga halotolerans TaxID=2993936 RepID=A0ABT3RR12_9BACT|nr:DUF547 domain-containing protein [Mangrovivirga halotolerans]MCX2744209.1 DUF547 domain-containing protein [Mangrovivirga halotolerans]
MNKLITVLSISLLFINCNSQDFEYAKNTVPPDHSAFSKLLNKYVDKEGMVDYKSMLTEKETLESYLNKLSSNPPSKDWTREEQLAYWINAYNGFTLKLILDNYPVKSIKDLHPTVKIPGVNTVWHKKFFKINGVDFNLDAIEHSILRNDFKEPRIHFAINCASISCPPLRNEAFFPSILNKQLDEQARHFINDQERNKLTKDKIEISKIFKWFTGDFTKKGTLIDYLNKFAETSIREDADIEYMEYDWTLNEK